MSRPIEHGLRARIRGIVESLAKVRADLGFISKVGVTQFRLFFSLDDNDDLGADYLKFFSGNSTTANMPQLIVTYYTP